MQIQLEKFNPDINTRGKIFFEIKKWGFGRKKSWGFDMQAGGIVIPDWARPKGYFVGGQYGGGSAEAAIKFAEYMANEFGSNAFFVLSREAKKELDQLQESVKYLKHE